MTESECILMEHKCKVVIWVQITNSTGLLQAKVRVKQESASKLIEDLTDSLDMAPLCFLAMFKKYGEFCSK